ncbi:MAG TPA: hypothetical protein DHW82_14200 [Spirochaetia bacterium]|nr:MAG: hypothetical protein A2Y41_00340 [Spirochaetes bacterium GWB1_36_13]HCL58142.1 hypothetical protein [Spirochaetia bacterium]
MKKSDYFIENAYGMTVIYLKHYHEEETSFHLPHLSYHLHFLISKDKDNILYIRCLDTDDLIDSSSTGIDNINDLIIDLIKNFFDIELKYFQEGILKREFLFQRADEKYWEKFNEIKETSYIKSKNAYLQYLSYGKKEKITYDIQRNREPIEKPLIKHSENGRVIEAVKTEEHLIEVLQP